MLEDLSTGSWLLLMGSLILGGFIYAWVADAVLGKVGFGVVLTTIFSTIAAYGGLWAMDWAAKTHQIPYDWQVPIAWASSAIVSTTLALLVLCVLKRLLIR